MLFWEQVPQQLINSLWLGSVYALFALGYTLVFGVIKELNLAHGGIFMWGAYIGLLCVTRIGLPLPLAFIAAMAGAGVLGVLLERLAYRPLRELSAGTGIVWAGFIFFLLANLRVLPTGIGYAVMLIGTGTMLVGIIMDYRGIFAIRPRPSDALAPLISSIGAASIMAALSQRTFGAQQSRFPLDTVPNHVFEWGGISITLLQIGIFLISMLMMAALHGLVFNTRIGRAMRAVACSRRVAALLGIHVDKIYLSTFFFSSALAGAAGVLHGLAFNAVTPFMGAPVQLKGLTVIVLGGMGSIQGAVLGGFAVALLEVFSVAAGQSSFREAIVFFLLFIMLMIRPQGLLGAKSLDKA